MATTVYDLYNAAGSGGTNPSAKHNAGMDAIERFFVQLAELVGDGIWAATDFNAAIVAGQLTARMSVGTGIIGGADAKYLVQKIATEDVTGLAATDTSYIWLVAGCKRLAFTSGSTAPVLGDTITGATSGATATVIAVAVTGGSWAGGDAAGYLYIQDITDTFEGEDLDIGATADVASIAGHPETTPYAVFAHSTDAGDAPAGGHLCATVTTDGTTVTSADNAPAGRVNLARLMTAGRAPAVIDAGRAGTGTIRLAANANDADTVTVAGTVYEFDNGGGVSGSNIAVTIGGTAALSAAALRAAILANQSATVRSSVRTANDTVVDLAMVSAGSALALAESTSGARIVVQANGDEAAPALRQFFHRAHTVTAEDVTQGTLPIDTGLSSLEWYLATFTGGTYDGGTAATGGVIEFDNSGSYPLTAGMVVEVVACGA